MISLCYSAAAQDAVSRITRPVINHYAGVFGISGTTVTLDTDVSFISATDTVLLIQMTGIPIEGNINTAVNYAGRYEFHIVTGVNGRDVALKSEVSSFFDPLNEIVQIVRVPSYKNAVIETTLSCAPWDSETGTGGVLALMVDETLTFNADIDVSGRGFKGGKAYATPYTGSCSFNAADNTDLADYHEGVNLSGYKGEGAVTRNYFETFPKGYGKTWNGGGGGNGKWSGGGGGANGGYGGIGGNQACGAPGSSILTDGKHGNDGFPIQYGDFIRSERTLMRVFMGGGGGAGTGTGTAGGNGGGIVIIVAEKLHFAPGASIKANGDWVEERSADAGAGGGGGGGSILLSVKDYGGIKAEITGGKGGSVYRGITDCSENSGNYTRGSGGGGSGGLLMTTRDTTEYSAWYRDTFKRNGGDEGAIVTPDGRSCDNNVSWPGERGTFFGNFQIQLRGFLHNYIFTPDTSVCNGVPVTVRASVPKGGAGTYTYEWLSSSDGDIWVHINNTPDLTYRFTEDILYVRRVVTSGDLTDTGSPILVSAYGIVNNDITPKDTITCRKETLTIRENIPTEGGGGEPYTYHWQEYINNTWTDINPTAGKNLTVPLQSSGIQTYRRQVTSGKGCVSEWSDASVIRIQPVITGNTITPDEQRVCEDTAGQLTGPLPTGGNGEYDYQWQMSSDGRVQWRNIPNHADEPDFIPKLVFPQTDDPEPCHDRYYRRYITSGACESFSNEVMVRFDRQSSLSRITSDDKLGDDALKFLFTDKLYAETPEVGVGIWTSGNDELNFNLPDEPVTTVNNLQIGVNTIYWMVTNGVCVSPSDSVKIEVKDIIIPTGFSPGKDGFNDCFRIVGAENATSSELIVFDRYNNVVFESKSFKGSTNLNDCSGWWDGRNMSGNDLPSGTYSYQFTLNGNKVYKGYVALKQQ